MKSTEIEAQRTRETVETLAGRRGNPLDHAFTRRDVADLTTLIASLRTGTGILESRISSAIASVTALSLDISGVSLSIAAATDELTEIQTGLSGAAVQLAAVQASVDAIQATAAAVSVPAIASAAIAAAPTQAEFNLAVADLTNLRQALADLKGAVS